LGDSVPKYVKTASLLLLIAVAGCTPQTPYERYKSGTPLRSFPYKTGANAASSNRAITDCEVTAAQRVPQQLVIQTTPTYVTPTQTQCNRYGTQTFCNTTGGQVMGGETYSRDANAGLRSRVYGQCMADKGYTFVDIPACPQGTPLMGSFAEAKLRPLSRNTCYLVTPNGTMAVGNLGT
jgi:hypothetical protein